MEGAPLAEGAVKLLPVKRELDADEAPERSEPAKCELEEPKAERRVVRRTASGQGGRATQPVKRKAQPEGAAGATVKGERTGSGGAARTARRSREAVVQRKPAARRQPASRRSKPAVKREKLEDEAPDTKSWRRKRKLLEVKSEPVEEASPPPWDARLPFYIAQCKAFQLAKRMWKRNRPCCAANCLQRVAGPPEEGTSCYESMTQAQKLRFEKLIANPEAAVREKPQAVSLRLFRMLLHPEREPDITVRRARVEDEPDVSALVPFRVPQNMAIGGESPSLAKALALAKARQEKMRTLRTRMGNRESGVPGVRWHEKSRAWVASWRGSQAPERTNLGKNRCFQNFSVDEYLTGGRTEEEANEEALQEAIIFRERLVSQGVMKVAKVGSNKGITWNKTRKGWDVYIRAYGKKMRGGFFKPVDKSPEAAERARQAAVEFREQLELRHGRHGSSIQRQVLQQVPSVVVPDDPVPARGSGAGASGEASVAPTRGRGGLVGVSWRRQGCHWRVQMWVNGKLDRRLFKPQEDRPEDLERELLAACRQDAE